MTTLNLKIERAEHVSGIVLQPLWRIHKIDWTVRKNVFETSLAPYSMTTIQTANDRDNSLQYPTIGSYRMDFPTKESAYLLFREPISGPDREKPVAIHRQRPSYNRKRWNCDLVRKPPSPQRAC